VRVIFRNFPLDMSCNTHVQNPMHEFSCEAARTAYCAQQQGKFQPLYEQLFEKQESLAKGKPLEFAKELGLDTAAIQTCSAAPQTNTAIQTDIEEGFRLGITSTPTFFINGRKIEGIQPLDAWTKIIDQLLASHG
jgi:protein-disulfide isomerase